MKKDEIMSFAGNGLNCEIIMLSKISQFHEDKYHMFSLICGEKNQKSKRGMIMNV
jgi:hypothetical protein